MRTMPRAYIDYTDPEIRREILKRQRRDMWTPEQVASLAKHFGLKPGKSLLDAGCGHGYGLRTFGPFCLPGGRLIGVDIEGRLLRTAKRLAREDGLGDDIEIRDGDINELPFESNTFDISIAHVVLCHLAKPERALDELIRVTRRGGCVAVFDNALAGATDGGWDNVFKPTIEQRLFSHRLQLLVQRERMRLRRGDWSVGCHVPGWMEARGLKNVDVRRNERVQWIAPPYRSPAQKTTIQNTRERCRESKFQDAYNDESVEMLRIAGVNERTIRRAVRASRRRARRFREAVMDGRASFTRGGAFWCIWGFKP